MIQKKRDYPRVASQLYFMRAHYVLTTLVRLYNRAVAGNKYVAIVCSLSMRIYE
jgi:hypothetical protein